MEWERGTTRAIQSTFGHITNVIQFIHMKVLTFQFSYGIMGYNNLDEEVSMNKPERVEGVTCPVCNSNDTVALYLETSDSITHLGWCSCGSQWFKERPLNSKVVEKITIYRDDYAD